MTKTNRTHNRNTLRMDTPSENSPHIHLLTAFQHKLPFWTYSHRFISTVSSFFNMFQTRDKHSVLVQMLLSFPLLLLNILNFSSKHTLWRIMYRHVFNHFEFKNKLFGIFVIACITEKYVRRSSAAAKTQVQQRDGA